MDARQSELAGTLRVGWLDGRVFEHSLNVALSFVDVLAKEVRLATAL